MSEMTRFVAAMRRLGVVFVAGGLAAAPGGCLPIEGLVFKPLPDYYPEGPATPPEEFEQTPGGGGDPPPPPPPPTDPTHHPLVSNRAATLR